MSDDSTVTVGVLSLHNSKETKAICNAIEALGHEPVWLRRENLVVDISGGDVHLEPEVDVIINRLLLSKSSVPCEELGLANTLARIRPMLNQPSDTLVALHKVTTAVVLSRAGIRVPDALLALESERLNQALAESDGETVYKTAIGTNGGGTWKVGPGDRVNARVGNRYSFLQSLVEPPDGERARDLRVYVVDDTVVGSMFRYAPEDDWRTNVALGGHVEDATDDLPESVTEIAVDAAAAVGLDFAGVDLVEDHGEWSVLEVNPTAGFRGLYEATGNSPAPSIARLGIERGGGNVEDDRIEALSTVFDDSTPDCKPEAIRAGTRDVQTIGYIEEVVLSGTSGSKTVHAKSDTGATRTSIDTGLAADIGAGPIKSITKVRSGSQKSAKSRPVVDLVVAVGGSRHTVTASVEDRSHMKYPVLLGRDILRNYQVDVSRQVDAEVEDGDDEEE